MKQVHIVSIVLTVLLLNCSRPDTSPYFFIQMADPQFGMFDGDDDFTKETELFTRAIEHANRLMPAYIVICGDLINRPADEKQRDEFLRILSLLDKTISIYLAPGNHDVGNEPTPESIAWYEERISHDIYSFRYKGTFGITVNSSLIHSPQNDPKGYEAQLNLLRNELKRADAGRFKNIFVFSHHPFFLENENEEDQYFNIPRERRDVFMSLFKDYGVDAIFAGHLHRNSYGESGDLRMITTGPVGKPLGDDPSGFRIVKVYPDSLVHDYYGFDEIPNEVTMDED